MIKVFILLLPLIFHFSCRQRAAGSKALHDEGITSELPASFWLKVDRSTFMLAAGGTSNGKTEISKHGYLDADHAVTKRIQAWVDELDRAFRESASQHGRHILAPKPTVIIENDPIVNAGVRFVTACLETPIRVEKFSANGPQQPERKKLVVQWYDASLYTESFPKCQPRLGWGANYSIVPIDLSKETLVGVFERLGRIIPGCNYKWDNKTIVLARSCLRNKFNDQDEFDGLVVPLAMDWFIVKKGLLQSLNEEQIVWVLSHELAHYYLAHGLTQNKDYGFLYEIEKQIGPGRPKLASSQQSLMQEAEAASEAYNNSDAPAVIDRLQKVVNQAKALKLGYYTTEQEADEYGLEQIPKVGLSVESAIDALFGFMQSLDQEKPSGPVFGDVSYDECKALYRKKFKKSDHEYVEIAATDFLNMHPKPCFRIFNAVREAELHKYSEKINSKPNIKPMTKESWSRLIAF